MAKPILKPGAIAPDSGQYIEVGPRGGRQSTTEITSTEGNRLPPTPKPGHGWQLTDPTKHKGK